MADNEVEPAAGPEPRQTPGIAQEAISRWTCLADDAVIPWAPTKGDFDNLYFAILGVTNAAARIHGAVGFLGAGDYERSRAELEKSGEAAIAGLSRLERFMEAVMMSAGSEASASSADGFGYHQGSFVPSAEAMKAAVDYLVTREEERRGGRPKGPQPTS